MHVVPGPAEAINENDWIYNKNIRTHMVGLKRYHQLQEKYKMAKKKKNSCNKLKNIKMYHK